MSGLPTDLLDVLNVSGLVVVLDNLGGGAAPPMKRHRPVSVQPTLPARRSIDVSWNPGLTTPIELPAPGTFRKTR